MKPRVVSNRRVVGDRIPTSIKVSTKEEYSICSVATNELITECRYVRLRGWIKVGVWLIAQQRQCIRDDLERVIAGAAEQQVAGLAVCAACQDVVAFVSKDPVFARTALQNVVARATQNHVPALGVFAK